MITSDDLRNLRAGPVISAGGLKDSTVRQLIFSHALRLGDREERESGNPQYDLGDAARIFTLYLLIKKIGMSGKTAVWAVNKAYNHITDIAEAELAAIDSGESPECPRYEFMLPAMALDVETNPEIRLHSAPEAVGDRESNRGRWCEIVLDLREIVRGARDNLVSALGHSTIGLSHDFADARDPEV